MSEGYRLIGAEASPYSVKMRAILRYRRLPFLWERRSERHASLIAGVMPPTMPYLVYPDGSVRNDSTLLAYDLERRHPEQRSLLTGDPCRDLLAHVIEDFADEWITRIMAHSRWTHEADQVFCSRWVAGEHQTGMDRVKLDAAAAAFRVRQTGRLLVLGASLMNRAVLESSHLAILRSLTGMLAQQEYLFGSRPSLADFGLFGQLYQMSIDPTASEVTRREAPEVLAWLLRLDDAGGVEGNWQEQSAAPIAAVTELLGLAGRTYLPLLQANAAAIAAGLPVCRVELDGMPFEQAASKYHLKCLTWLREEYARLEAGARRRADRQFDDAGCGAYFAAAPHQ